MDANVVSEIVKHANKGQKIHMRRDHAGQVILKIKTGPLGFVTRRYSMDFRTWEAIKRRLCH